MSCSCSAASEILSFQSFQSFAIWTYNWVFPKCFHWIQLIQWQTRMHSSRMLLGVSFQPPPRQIPPGQRPHSERPLDRDCSWQRIPWQRPQTETPSTTVPARHMWETLNWLQFMLQWFIRFPEFNEFLSHLGKSPVNPSSRHCE